MLAAIDTRFCDDETTPPFEGYTDGSHWNGFERPHFPMSEFIRVLDLLVAWGDEKSYEVIDSRTVRVCGLSAGDEYVMRATRCATNFGEQWLFDCGGAWTFVEACAEAEAA